MKWWYGADRANQLGHDEEQPVRDGELGAAVWEAPLESVRYFVIDIETSGFSPTSDHILSLAAACISGQDPTLFDTFYEVVQLDAVADVTERVWALTGLTPEQVVRGQPIRDVLFRALSLSVNKVWVAHHARHELSFLQRQTKRMWRMPLRPIVIDTSVVARALWRLPEVPTLESVCDRLGVPVTDRHRADADVAMTAQVWARQLTLCRAMGLSTVAEVVEWAAERG
ncbi:exonuclease domain-containing protein [Alicyclobacillus sp. ALC3]|uniref:exonuclease domain-containing protein n=1 Tax=Alicyclobacillus sp. ALC3 TaxID=2796143 RepID=UPI0023791294|nr:exonuclease domain-containing protein [Alicyclobacillus sp. ALC3]WDL97282.1 DNA polymerase III subunit epsilon [Alicyclobacillus sp. ALC3]